MRLFIILLILNLVSALVAQSSLPTEGKEQSRSSVVIKIMPVYQNWSMDMDTSRSNYSQASTLLFFQYPINNRSTVSLQAARAKTGGDMESINGLTDMKIGGNWRIPTLNSVFFVNVNLPSGKSKLSREQFATSIIISNPVLQLQVPNFGQGWMLSSGITWANALSGRFVLGGGISYLYSAAYTALKGYDAYNPGNELLLTGGMDFRLNASATLSLDVIYTIYGKDKFGGVEVLAPGNKQVYSLQYRHFFGHDQLQVLLRYRTRARNQLIVLEQTNKIIPDNIDFLAHYHHRFSPIFFSSIIGEARHFRSSLAQLSQGTVFTIGVVSGIKLNSTFSLPLQLKYHFGTFREYISLSGVEMSLAVQMML